MFTLTVELNNIILSQYYFVLVLGDPRVNQNPGVLALAVIFYRWHNYHAMIVKRNQPDWVDEDIFQAARRRVISTLQVPRVALTS